MKESNKILRDFILRRMRKHQHPGSGSHWDPVRDRKISTAQLAERKWLRDVMGGVPYLIIGRLAVNQYAPPQQPIDTVEIFVSPEHLTNAKRRAEQCRSEGKQVEVVTLDGEWGDEALCNPNVVAELPVMGLPYLLMLKMRCETAQDIADAQRMLHGTGPAEREHIRAVFLKYAPADIGDLEELMRLSDEAW